MNSRLLPLLMATSLYCSPESKDPVNIRVARAASAEVVHVATALDHLTVLEFGEPVAMVASGSTSFQIERQDDKVLVKPLRAGVSTDLLVWTGSRRLIYELEAPGEVADMNFAVDSRAEAGRVVPTPAPPTEESVESVMGKAFLAALKVESDGVHPVKDGVSVRIEHLLLSKKNVYVHYSVVNRGKRPYVLGAPHVDRLLVSASSLSPLVPRRTQVSLEHVKKIGRSGHVALEAASVQMSATEVKTGERAEGVIVLPQPLAEGTVLELTFPPEGNRHLEAVLVL